MVSEKKVCRRKGGFTLIETVMALSITAVLGGFLAGFIHPQLKLYYDLDRISQAKAMCGQAYRELEEELRYGYMFYFDHRNTGELSYYIRNGNMPERLDEPYYEELPPVEQWPKVSAEELDVTEMENMELELDFTGTKNTQVHVSIKVKKDGDIVYEQEAVISSMYAYTVNGEGGI